MEFNLNKCVSVRLTEEGRRLLRCEHDALYAHVRSVSVKTKLPEYAPVSEDNDGWSKWQLWQLMATFGPYMFNGCRPPFELNIRIPTEANPPQPHAGGK